MQSVSAHAAEFWHWWTGELSKLLPRGFIAFFRRPRHTLVCAVNSDTIELIQEREGSGGRVLGTFGLSERGLTDLAASVDRVITKQKLQSIGIRIPETKCFRRELSYPVEARSRLKDILKLDLTHSMPFEESSIYSDYCFDHSPDDRRKLAVTYLVVKRDILDQHVDQLSAAGIPIAFADVWTDDVRSKLPLDFLRDDKASTEDPRLRKVLLRGALIAIAVLASATIHLAFERQEQALNLLQEKTKKQKTKSQQIIKAQETVRKRSEIITSLQSAKSLRYSVIECWQELTKRLPDSVWITTFRLTGNTLQITGFAQSAASLIETLERSVLFEKTKLTAPVSVDVQTKKERFSIQTRLRPKPALGKPPEPDGGRS